jgi:hypothetical protein
VNFSGLGKGDLLEPQNEIVNCGKTLSPWRRPGGGSRICLHQYRPRYITDRPAITRQRPKAIWRKKDFSDFIYPASSQQEKIFAVSQTEKHHKISTISATEPD